MGSDTHKSASGVVLGHAYSTLNEKITCMGVNVYPQKTAGKRINPPYTRSTGGSGFTMGQQSVSCELELKLGSYIVVPSTFDLNEFGDFRLAVHSSKKTTFAELN